jgi:glucosamine--fructose-6-phosphate aminotransferase (isomerizing)
VNPDAFIADVLAAPETLAAVLDAYDRPGSPLAPLTDRPLDGRRVVFIGMGSSRYAALDAAAALRARGIAAVAEYASAEVVTPPGPDVVAVGISASGTTEETVAALARHHGTSTSVAITNAPESALADAADIVLPLLAGEERGGVACRTFQATRAVLLRLCGVPTAALAAAPAAQAALLEARDGWLEPLLATLEGGPAVYAIAPAEREASALQAALMFREGPRIAADGCETGDWLHVDVYLSKYPGYRALLFGGSRFDPGVMEWARERSSTIVSIGRPVPGATLHVGFPYADHALVSALVEVSVAELAAGAWWRRRAERGEMP